MVTNHSLTTMFCLEDSMTIQNTIQNIGLFHSELVACGLPISGCSSDGTIHFLAPDENNIAPLVLAAHGQPLSSDECLALQAALTEEQWLAYQDARKAPVRAMRAERYKSVTDPLFMAAMEESTTLFDAVEQVYNVKVDKTKWDSWIQEKSKIREEFPYE